MKLAHRLAAYLFAISAVFSTAHAATLMPNGMNCFSTVNGAVSGGTVGFYIPGTQILKQTWQDAGQTILNTNPVMLDQNGCALIYGEGSYRQVLKDSLANQIWDQLTSSTDQSGIFWAGAAGGTGNAITITDSTFANTDGTAIQFRATATNTGAVTIAVSGGSPITLVKDTSSGPAPLTGGEIATGNIVSVVYDANGVQFHLVNTTASTSSATALTGPIVFPQGYLNLVGAASGNVIQTGDVIGATTVYYSPFVGSNIPIYNGSSFVVRQFTELTLSLTAGMSPSSTIQDVCVFSNNGTLTAVVGPSWQTVTAGSGARGTGAGTPQLTRLQGVWVNAVQITGSNGANSYTVPANQCTYVGSLYIDSTAGQVTAHKTYGQSRKWGVWNAYNRQPIYLKAGDSTGSWNVAGGTAIRPSNNNAANSLTIFSGLAEESYRLEFSQHITGNPASANSMGGIIGVGYNSTSATSGKQGSFFIYSTGNTTTADMNSLFLQVPSIGIQTITALESTTGASQTTTFYGAEPYSLLSAWWRG